MEKEIEWIKEALALDSTKTQTGLAKALNIDKSSVSRLLRGERRLKFTEARNAATYLGVTPPSGFGEEAEEFQPAYDGEKDRPSFASLFKATVGDNGFWRLDRNNTVERKPISPQLAGVSSAFGFYIPDASMAPRFKIGEIAWVNPARPAAPGDDALIVAIKRKNAVDTVFLCELLEIQDGQWSAHQFGSGRTQCFSPDKWCAFHVLSRG